MILTNKNIKFTCKASFLEIYQEKIYDLLATNNNSINNANKNLSLREDKYKNVFVDNLNYNTSWGQLKDFMKKAG